MAHETRRLVLEEESKRELAAQAGYKITLGHGEGDTHASQLAAPQQARQQQARQQQARQQQGRQQQQQAR